MSAEVLLSGLDGSNPLAFLAALGTLRVLDLQRPKDGIRMRWKMAESAWRPLIDGNAARLDAEMILSTLDDYLRAPPQAEILKNVGLDLTLTGKKFRSLSLGCVTECEATETRLRRSQSDFLAAFGCDAVTHDDGPDSLIQDTALRTMSGAGHQHFVQFMLEIIKCTEIGHLKRALFETWTYEDEGRGKNMRWDPQDDRRYALRWKNPSADPNTTVRGANRLAIEALPLMTTAPVYGHLETTGFTQIRGKGVRWTWPIWERPIDTNVCRSLLQLEVLQNEPQEPNELIMWQAALRRRGIAALFQSQRITTGKFRSFAPARPVVASSPFAL